MFRDQHRIGATLWTFARRVADLGKGEIDGLRPARSGNWIGVGKSSWCYVVGIPRL